MSVQIAGEDQVTMAIVERLITQYRPDLDIGPKRPSRGSQLKPNAPKYNQAGTPMIILTDLDLFHCAPQLKNDWFGNADLHPNLIFRVAVDEAESWLMADRHGLADWLGINVDLIPKASLRDAKKAIVELNFDYKPSLFLMRNLAIVSSKSELRNALIPLNGAKKGPMYNTALIPFIRSIWNPEAASLNSYSLSKAIERIRVFAPVQD